MSQWPSSQLTKFSYIKFFVRKVADDAVQMDVHKALYPFYTAKKISHDTATVTKMRFLGSNNQVYYDNLHYGAQPFRFCRPHYVYFMDYGGHRLLPQVCLTVFLLSMLTQQTRGPKHAGRMWPAKAFCAARDAFWEYSYKQQLRYLIYWPVFKSARPASEQVPFKRMYIRDNSRFLSQEIRSKSCF